MDFRANIALMLTTIVMEWVLDLAVAALVAVVLYWTYQVKKKKDDKEC